MPVTLQMWEKAQRRIAELKAKSTDLEQRAIRAASENALLIKKVKELETKLANAESLIDYAELSIDEAVEDGWEPPSECLVDTESGTRSVT